MTKIYGYIRAQINPAQKGSADLHTQRDELNSFARRRRFSYDKIFCDDAVPLGASVMSRNDGEQLLNILKRDDTVVSPSFDRLFLTLSDAQNVIESFVKNHVRLRLVNLDTVFDCAQFLAIVPAIQSAEQEHRSLFIRAGKDKARQQGGFTGGTIPFGWRLGPEGMLIEEPDDQKKLHWPKNIKKRLLLAPNSSLTQPRQRPFGFKRYYQPNFDSKIIGSNCSGFF